MVTPKFSSHPGSETIMSDLKTFRNCKNVLEVLYYVDVNVEDVLSQAMCLYASISGK